MLRQPTTVSPGWRGLLGYTALAGALAACVDVPARSRFADEGSAEDVGADFDRPPDGAPDPEPSDRGPTPDARLDLGPGADMAEAAPDLGPEPDMAVGDAEVEVDLAVPGERLRLSIDGLQIDGEDHSLGQIPVGTSIERSVAVANFGDDPVQFGAEAVRLVELDGVGIELIERLPDGELGPHRERAFRLRYTARVAGAARAEVTVMTDRGTAVSATISAEGVHPVHVAASAAGILAHSDSLGQRWTSVEVAGGLGADVEVACSGPCPEPGMPQVRVDARCVAVGSSGDGGVAYATSDGEDWRPADFDAQPPPLLAVDYGPPWVAVDNQGRIWRSDNGRAWARTPVMLDTGLSQPTGLAANHRGDVMVIGTVIGWWFVPAEGEPSFHQAAGTLLRVANGPDGSFTAVGNTGNWLRVEPDGLVTTSGRFDGVRLATDITYGEAFGTRGWLALVGERIWSRPDGGDWEIALDSGSLMERFALGAGGFVGGLRNTTFALAHGADDWEIQPDAPAGLNAFAAFDRCVGGADPVGGPSEP